MIVAARTLEVLAIFALLGLPLNLLLFRQIGRGNPSRGDLSARLLLAPASGLAVFAICTGFFFAIRQPVLHAVPALWLLLAVLWFAAFVQLRRIRGLAVGRLAAAGTGWPPRVSGSCLLAGLGVVLAAYLWPFFRQSDLIFWHYAGSDGYMYMRIAEHVASPGSGVIPSIGPYDAASGFLAEVMRNFHDGGVQDKPGTMATLAGLGALSGRIPHEMFSPLVLATVVSLYLALWAFGQSLLRLPAWGNVLFAALGTLAPSVWMMATHTFLGNLLALPLYVTLLLVAGPLPRRRTAVYFGLIFGAQIMLFPDGTLAIVGLLGMAAPVLCWHAWRRRQTRRLLMAGLLSLVTAGALISLFGHRLVVTAFGRLLQVFVSGPKNFTQTPTGESVAPAATVFKPLTQFDWIWGALNLNTIPPQPLKATELPYLYALIFLGAGFFAACLWRRAQGQMASYLAGFLCLLLIGLGGFFKSDYELFRGLAVFAFVPLAALFALPWLVAGHARTWSARIPRLVVLALLAPMVMHFARNDLYHFRFAYDQHASDAQYTTADLRDREAVARLAPGEPLVLGAETASFTALARSLTLFSNRPLGIPKAFHKFAFFFTRLRGPSAYTAAWVLHNRSYADIFERVPELPAAYASAGYAVVPNDLVAFADNDTFPTVHAFTQDFLTQRNLANARLLSAKTVVEFMSQSARAVTIVVQFAPGQAPSTLDFSFDAEPARRLPPKDADSFVLQSGELAAGLHALRLGPLDHPAQVVAVKLFATATPDPLGTLRDCWVDYAGLNEEKRALFQSMSPAPVRFHSQFGPSAHEGFFGAHPDTRLVYRVAAGPRRLRAQVQIAPGAYEQLPPDDATDGVLLEIAILHPDGRRLPVHTRLIDPFNHAADRGVLPIDVRLEVPEGAEIELLAGPGARGNLVRDWFSIGTLTID